MIYIFSVGMLVGGLLVGGLAHLLTRWYYQTELDCCVLAQEQTFSDMVSLLDRETVTKVLAAIRQVRARALLKEIFDE